MYIPRQKNKQVRTNVIGAFKYCKLVAFDIDMDNKK